MSAYDGYAGEATVAKSDREVTHVVRELEKQPELIAHIQEGLSELEKRLGGVLRQEEESPNNSVPEPHIVLVPMAEQIRAHNDGLRFNYERLKNILDRLEL